MTTAWTFPPFGWIGSETTVTDAGGVTWTGLLKALSDEPSAPPRWVVRGDEELAEFNYQSRTSPDNGAGLFPCTPSVFRYYKTARDKSGDFRVDISPLLSAYLALHSEDSIEDPKTRYFFGVKTGFFNTTGYPRQAYITTSGNELRGERVGDWLCFDTLTPSSNVAGMTHESHPHFVHRMDLVCWARQEDGTFKTTHKVTTPQGIVDYFLVTVEGVGWIPLRNVRMI